MRLVYIPGVFDLLHVGHLTVLERARALGDCLIVGVPSDDVVLADKGEPPIIPLEARLRMLQALQCVDAAAPYDRLEFLTHLSMFRPDVLVIGGTWGHEKRHEDALRWMQTEGGRVVQLPYSSEESTSAIRWRIKESFDGRPAAV